jgi:GntR family transcriptional regulator
LLRIQITTGGKVPIYRQIVDQIRSGIASGNLVVGDGLPSVRGLATELVVNPNTVAKAFNALLQDGLIESQQGRGYFVAQRRQIYSKKERSRRLSEAASQLVCEASVLGLSEADVVAEIKKQFEKVVKS